MTRELSGPELDFYIAVLELEDEQQITHYVRAMEHIYKPKQQEEESMSQEALIAMLGGTVE